MTTSGLVLPNGQGPAGALIHCNRLYTYPDADGSYSIQHLCGAGSSPWGYKISAAVCAIATSSVAEAGMGWTYNGHYFSGSPHPSEGCGYPYHGVYNPDFDNDHISYVDTFKFTTQGGGHATLQIYGSFTSLGSPCSPTSC